MHLKSSKPIIPTYWKTISWKGLHRSSFEDHIEFETQCLMSLSRLMEMKIWKMNNNKFRGFKVLIIFGHENIPTSLNFDHMCVGVTLWWTLRSKAQNLSMILFVWWFRVYLKSTQVTNVFFHLKTYLWISFLYYS